MHFLRWSKLIQYVVWFLCGACTVAAVSTSDCGRLRVALELRLGEARLQSEHSVPQCATREITSTASDEECCTRGRSLDSLCIPSTDTHCYASANNTWRKHYVFWFYVHLSVRRLSISTPISCNAISLYLVEGFQWNLPQIFIMRMGITENVLEVRGQGRDQTQ